MKPAPALLACGTAAAAAVVATFAELDAWVAARRPVEPRPAAVPALLEPRAPVVEGRIDADLAAAFPEADRNFVPFLDVRECTPERVRMEHSNGGAPECLGVIFTLELILERRADGSIGGTLTKRLFTCLRPVLPGGERSPPQERHRSARVVLSRDWYGAQEHYLCAVHPIEADGSTGATVWYRVSP